ncbi:MAG: hypothetical protein PVH19_01795 [Planctomycetia bacterium]|jgi:hypothetical protein
MSCPIEELVQQIHESPSRFVLALSGGGTGAIKSICETPGATRTLLEAIVPYSSESMTDWLGGKPDRFCSAGTARRMAMVAWFRANKLDDSEAPRAGVSCTASLATDRPKRGEHRAHVAIQTTSFTATRSIFLEKGRRTREEEELLVSRMVIDAIAEACGLQPKLELDLGESESFMRSQTIAPPAWQELLCGKRQEVRIGGEEKSSKGLFQKSEHEGLLLFAGAFNPLHRGHRGMAEAAEEIMEQEVEYEISIINPDKPPTDFTQMKERVEQFKDRPVWLTRAPTFAEKAKLFPRATFIVGIDTLRRIADVKYYGDDPAACRAALERISVRGCRFLVFGRNTGTGFVGLGHLNLPDVLADICQEVPSEKFREDISSTEIRQARLIQNQDMDEE